MQEIASMSHPRNTTIPLTDLHVGQIVWLPLSASSPIALNRDTSLRGIAGGFHLSADDCAEHQRYMRSLIGIFDTDAVVAHEVVNIGVNPRGDAVAWCRPMWDTLALISQLPAPKFAFAAATTDIPSLLPADLEVGDMFWACLTPNSPSHLKPTAQLFAYAMYRSAEDAAGNEIYRLSFDPEMLEYIRSHFVVPFVVVSKGTRESDNCPYVMAAPQWDKMRPLGSPTA